MPPGFRGLWVWGLVLAIWFVATTADWIEDKDAATLRLLEWAEEGGARLDGVAIGRACATCPRGVFATRDFQEGEELMAVPFGTILRLSDPPDSGGAYPAEYARELLDWMHNYLSHNETWGAFWDSQPGPDGVFTPEVWTDEHLALLQCPELEAVARSLRDVSEQVYHGTYAWRQYAPFNETVPEDKVPLHTFNYVASLIGSRFFGFYRDGDDKRLVSHMVPVIDLINHSEDDNAARHSDNDWVTIQAARPIQAGEEINHKYQWGILHRCDESLRHYGYCTMQDWPLLLAIDLPGHNPDATEKTTPPDDSAHDAGGDFCTWQEYNRLASRLAALPTSEEEDQALLDDTEDWRLRAILQFRITRKRALRQTLERICRALGEQDDGSSDAAGLQAAASCDAQATAALAAAGGGTAAEAQDEVKDEL